MKKILFATSIFLSLGLMASAQEKTAKVATEEEIQNAKLEKIARERKMAEKKQVELIDNQKNNPSEKEVKMANEAQASEKQNNQAINTSAFAEPVQVAEAVVVEKKEQKKVAKKPVATKKKK